MQMPYHSGKNPGPGPSGPRYSQPRASTMMKTPRPANTAPETMSPVLMLPSSFVIVIPACAGTTHIVRLRLFLRPLRLLVTLRRYDLGDDAVGAPEFYGDDAGIADDLAAVFPEPRGAAGHVVHLDRKMVDAGLLSRGERFCGSRALVVLHQREVELAVGHVARDVVARLARFYFLETENLLVERGCLLEVFDLERKVNNAIHMQSPKLVARLRKDGTGCRRSQARDELRCPCGILRPRGDARRVNRPDPQIAGQRADI